MVEKSSYQWDGDSRSLFDRQINSRNSFGGKTLKALSYKSQNVFFFLTFWSLENHLISKPSQKLDIYLPWNTWYIYSVVNRDFDETLFGPLIIVETEPKNSLLDIHQPQIT